jgi:hypothetical protein
MACAASNIVRVRFEFEHDGGIAELQVEINEDDLLLELVSRAPPQGWWR